MQTKSPILFTLFLFFYSGCDGGEVSTALTPENALDVVSEEDSAVEADGKNQGEDGITTQSRKWEEFCSSDTVHQWSLDNTDDLDFFPDPLLEVEDPTSPTGRKMVVTSETAPWIESIPDLLYKGIASLDGSSGVGTVGGLLIRFTGGVVTDVPGNTEESLTSEGWQLLDLETAPPTRVPFEARVLEDGATMIVWPLRPLELASRHAFLVTQEAVDSEGNCIAPSPLLRALLDEESTVNHPNAAATRSALLNTLNDLNLQPEALSVFSVFTTHNEPAAWLNLAAEADGEAVAWTDFEGCEDRGIVEECTAWLTVMDRRDETGAVSPAAVPTEAPCPVTIWRPKDQEGPLPVIFYGHGLSSHRTEGYFAAKLFAEAGGMTIAMDAIGHGDHPSAEGGDSTTAALGFLGVDLATVSINPALLRGNFDQTNLDRRRFLRLIQEDPDFDGDGSPDFDTTRMGYLGVSLGAILGPQLLSITPEMEAVIFSVGGGRLMSIVTDTTELEAYMGIIATLIGSEERFHRLVPIAQHVVDPADSALWSSRLIRNRFDGAKPPSVMLHVGIDDEVVPKSAGHMMARSLGLTHLQPVAEPVPLLNAAEGPLRGNGPEGITEGFFQYDRVTVDGKVVASTHVETPSSDEAQYQIRHFIESWLGEGVPEVVNPYSVFDTPQLN